jgi:hypothetical protein
MAISAVVTATYPSLCSLKKQSAFLFINLAGLRIFKMKTFYYDDGPIPNFC